jgi:hypothetical protein
MNELMKRNQRKFKKYLVLILASISIPVMASVPGARADGFAFIERPKLGFSSSCEMEEEKRTLAGNETEITSRDVLEKFTVGTKGWLYHENLLTYRLAIMPEWRQEKFTHHLTESDFSYTEKRNTSVMAYDTGATLLKQKPCSLDLFANRNTRNLDLSYTQDTDIETQTFGTRLNYTNALLPASIGYINRQSDQTGFYNAEEDRDQFQVKIGHNIKNSITEVNILHDETDRITRTPSESRSIASNTTNSEVSNTFFFTLDESARLDSLLYLTRAQYDDVDIDTSLLSENFFWTQSKNLLLQSALNLNRRDVDGSEAEGKALSALLTFRMNEMLKTNVGAGAALNNYAVGSEDCYRTNLGFLYRRPLPWGSVGAGVGYDYGMTRRNGTGSMALTEDRLVLTTGVETFLEQENIAFESILVTDATGTNVYIENIDYRLFDVGSRVQISRALMGSIAEDQQVMVRYNYRVDAGYDDRRFGQDYRFDVEWSSMIYLSLMHRRLNQSIVSGNPPANRMDDTFNSARLRFDAGWSETSLEFEKQDRRNGNSTQTTSVNELVNLRALRSLSFNLSGRYGNREYTDTNEKETFYTLGMDAGWTPRWWYTFNLICLWNKISGDRQDMAYSQIYPKIGFRYGVWTATLAYRLTDQEDRDYEDSLWRQKAYFMVNRELW